jgi:simple sugar transport system ATP-binding protein
VVVSAALAPESGPRPLLGVDVSGVGVKGPPRIEARNMTKSFGGNVVLDQVSLTLEPGTVHALLGENGAGKSTLVKCLMGFYEADAGELAVNGEVVSVKSPRDAQARGIGMVYQHFTLVENMTVAENLLIARQSLPALIDWKRELADLTAFMQKMPFHIQPTRLVRQLAAGEKQKLEILKQLYLGSRVIILDEPTSVLTPDEADEVLGLVRQMAERGELSVLVITHKFREVLAFADQVTILRRGKLVATDRVQNLTPEKMAELMVGAEPPKQSSTRAERAAGDVALELERVEADDDIGLPVLEGVSLDVRAGEIVGIAGVSGNGQEELVEVLAGQRTLRSGSVRVAGDHYRSTRDHIRTRRVRLLPEAPLKNACVSRMALAHNIAFRDYDRPPFTLARWGLRPRSFKKRAEEAIRMFRIRTPGPLAPIGTLSGGNVQRAVLARELAGEVRVLIAANPCFGLDFGAVAEIRSRIMDARNAGTAVLLISADLEEIFALSDRILVMSEGRIVYETPAATADVREIGRHMAGHA